MRPTDPQPRFVVCVKNKDYPASLEVRKLYQVVADPAAAKHHQLRVIDESGEDYLYPEEYFVPVQLPEAAEKAVLRAATLHLRSSLTFRGECSQLAVCHMQAASGAHEPDGIVDKSDRLADIPRKFFYLHHNDKIGDARLRRGLVAGPLLPLW